MRAGKRRHRAVRRLGAADWKAARKLVARLEQAFAPLDQAVRVVGQGAACTTLSQRTSQPPRRWPSRADGEAATPLWQGEAGEGAAKFFASLLDERPAAPDMQAADYPEFYRSLVADEEHPPARAHASAHLHLGARSKSRLQQPDVVILGSLNEGTWPQAADPGPLAQPADAADARSAGAGGAHRRGGARSSSRCSAPQRVYLTRAAKIDGVPTVPSRWLLRLQALLGGIGPDAGTPSEPWLAWAQARNAHRRPARARAGARAAAARGAAAAPAQRHDHREVDRQSLRHLRRAHPGARAAARARPRARCGTARPDRARGARPLRAALSRSRCRRTSQAS